MSIQIWKMREGQRLMAAKGKTSLLSSFVEPAMLVKLTTKNQITLPKAVVSAVDAAEYFDVQVENGRIVLMPARDQLQRLGISEQDVADAIAWARRVKIKQDRARRQKSWR